MLPHPLENFPWSDRASMTSCQVDGTLACYLSSGIALIDCVFGIQSILLLSFIALNYTLLYFSSRCSALVTKQPELCFGCKWYVGRPGGEWLLKLTNQLTV